MDSLKKNKLQENHLQKNDERIEKILNLLLKYTLGEFHVRETVSDKGDELDAIIIGLNTLGEEAAASGRMVQDYEVRSTAIMDVLLKYTLFDFTEKVPVTAAGDELDAIAIGLNTMAEELQSANETEKKQIEEINKLNAELKNTIFQLESTNAELEAFTYSVSHDLRAPLRAIHSFTKIIEEDYAPQLDDEAKNMMRSVMNNAKRMGQLIDDLLALSRYTKRELTKKTTDMTLLVNQCLDELKKSTNTSKTKITIDNLGTAKVDPALMFQVFINLLSNAVKYSSTKDQPEVHVGCEKKDNETIFFVKDNGTGFDMKYYDKLFGVFQRLHSMDEFEGTGVGLALIKRIVTRHGGKVWAEAEVDKGASFYVSLTNKTV